MKLCQLGIMGSHEQVSLNYENSYEYKTLGQGSSDPIPLQPIAVAPEGYQPDLTYSIEEVTVGNTTLTSQVSPGLTLDSSQSQILMPDFDANVAPRNYTFKITAKDRQETT